MPSQWQRSKKKNKIEFLFCIFSQFFRALRGIFVFIFSPSVKCVVNCVASPPKASNHTRDSVYLRSIFDMAQTNNNSSTAVATEGSTNPRDSRIIDDRKPDIPKNVGHLLKEPVEIDCPACHKRNMTRVHKTAVTFCQMFVAAINALCCCW